jgi:glycosyltransferase involved in cell wall biosynthesis
VSRCIVITHQHSLGSPGGGTLSCLQIAHHLQQLGTEVILLPVWRGPAANLKETSVQAIPVPQSRVHYLLDGLSVAKTVQTVLAKRQVDAVLSWDYEAAFLPELLQAKKIVFGMIAAAPSYKAWLDRNTTLRSVKSMTDNWFRWRPLRYADVVFVSSSFTRQELIGLFKLDCDRIVTTHRGIDIRFSKVQRSFTGKISNLIFYGSLAPLKGIFDVIEALGRVAAQGQRNWVLKVAGWDNEESVRQALHEHRIDEQVVLLGRLEPQALIRELEWADLAILPSHAESFGRAIAEAQASGLPVVSYEVGSVPEVVQKGVTGWLAPLGHVELLAEAIIAAMQDPEKSFQMGLAGRERVTQLFSWEQTAMAILHGIEEAKRRRA